MLSHDKIIYINNIINKKEKYLATHTIYNPKNIKILYHIETKLAFFYSEYYSNYFYYTNVLIVINTDDIDDIKIYFIEFYKHINKHMNKQKYNRLIKYNNLKNNIIVNYDFNYIDIYYKSLSLSFRFIYKYKNKNVIEIRNNNYIYYKTYSNKIYRIIEEEICFIEKQPITILFNLYYKKYNIFINKKWLNGLLKSINNILFTQYKNNLLFI